MYFSLQPGLSSCSIWSCDVGLTAPGFLPILWRKHEWSCCQEATEIFVVAAASARHMSKGSVWINDFSRGWSAKTDSSKGSALPTKASLFWFTRMDCLIDFGKYHWSSIYQTCYRGNVSSWGVIWEGVKILSYAYYLLRINKRYKQVTIKLQNLTKCLFKCDLTYKICLVLNKMPFLHRVCGHFVKWY